MQVAINLAAFAAFAAVVLGWNQIVAAVRRMRTKSPTPPSSHAAVDDPAVESKNLEAKLAAGRFTVQGNFDAAQRMYAIAEMAQQTGHPLGEEAVDACRKLFGPLVMEWPMIATRAAKIREEQSPALAQEDEVEAAVAALIAKTAASASKPAEGGDA